MNIEGHAYVTRPLRILEPEDGEQPTTDWRDGAICTSVDPELFYPEKGASTTAAKKICSGCEVIAECLEVALANNERFGVWGGMSDRERRRLSRGDRRRSAVCGTSGGYRAHFRRGESPCLACRDADHLARAIRRGAA